MNPIKIVVRQYIRSNLDLVKSAFLSSYRLLTYSEHGNPLKVLNLSRGRFEEEDSLGTNDVLVKWLAAPINPSDINQIQGVYPIKQKLPAVGGNEGCGTVQTIGSSVLGLKPGDRVISDGPIGTWCEFGIYNSDLLYPIDEDLPGTSAAMIKVNPPTAYRMIKDFACLKEGDSIIQNGANSAVGQNVIQIARLLGLRTINIVRDKTSTGELNKRLREFGATEVLTESEFERSINEIKVKLAFNCIGGKSSLQLSRVLTRGGCIVTYGGMSRAPCQIAISSLIFNDISVRGFWISDWYTDRKNREERKRMYGIITEWYKNGELMPVFHKENKLEEFESAIQNTIESTNGKQIFVF